VHKGNKMYDLVPKNNLAQTSEKSSSPDETQREIDAREIDDQAALEK
jgi:hypothetical protein